MTVKEQEKTTETMIDIHKCWRNQQILKISVEGESALAHPLITEDCFSVYDYIVTVEKLKEWIDRGFTIEVLEQLQ